jgi:hypothetical protein
MNWQAFGGRRFVLAAGAGVVSTILVWFSKIGDTVFASIVIATVAAYISGNVGEQHVLTRNQGGASAPGK